jgi:cell division protein ZapA
MTIEIKGTTVEVLGKTFQVKHPENETVSLQKAASYLEEKMREVRSNTSLLSIDRIAVIVALNLSHQLLTAEHDSLTETQKLNDRLQELNSKMENILAQHAQLELQSAES